MTDLLVILATLAFFALCAVYVHLCDRVIGPDEITSVAPDGADATPVQIAA